VDSEGNPAPPGPDTLKILRLAKNLWNHKQFLALEHQLEKSIKAVQEAKQQKSRERLQHHLGKFLSLHGHRQFTNRVFTRKSVRDQALCHQT
jgi:dissimilatory sulfite reductase (desulfoviridin) alpha/beta subunit